MKWSRHIIYVSFILLFSQFSWGQQTEDDIRDQANKLFEQEEYVQATPLFLQLTSLNPKSHDYNFKYGTCLLYNSNQKNKGLRYLNYAIKDPDIDDRAYFYRGKALHLDYQFDLAKKSYQRYLNEAGKNADPRFETERFIQMCDNGKRLLTQFTDIVVADKKEIDQNKFFRIYTDAETVKGYILVSEQFQSKIDKKKGHVPIVHFPPDASAVYYASYGDNDANGLDVYVRKKLPDGSWGLEQRLPGEVNTQYDENFPYLHPSGRFLYFSSKGHNSMGGYDIFMSRYRDDTYDWGPPENIDFAISSPDDDLFYVVDSLFQNAYFASARQSQDGKLHVYKVKVVRVPIQEVIVMGDFESTISPGSSQLFIKLSETKSGKQVAETESNAQNKYAIVFPQGGKYNYEIEITTSQETRTFTVELPFQDELRPLKQKILHTMEDGQEVVKIINLFDEDVEGAEEIIANLIRKKAELEVNIENFDLDKLEEEQRKKELLAELGYNNMRPDEITDQILELQKVQDQNKTQLDVIKSNVQASIIQKSEEIAKLEEEQKDLEAKIANEIDPIKKHQLLSLAKQKEYEKRSLSDQIQALQEFETETTAKISKGLSSNSNMQEIADKYNSLLESGEELEALKHLKANQKALDDVRNSAPEQILEDLIAERVKVNNDLDRVKYEEGKMDRRIDQLQSEINVLESKLFEAKRKEIPQIEADIASKKREIETLQEEKKYGESKKKELAAEINKLDSQISTMQEAIREKEPIAINEDAYDAALQKAEQNSSDEELTPYDSEIAMIEEEYPELANNTYSSESSETIAAISEIKREASASEQNIASRTDLSEEQRLEELIENVNETLEKIDERIEYLESEIASNPDNTALAQELKELKEYKIRQEGKKFDYETQLSEISSTASTSNEINEAEVWEEFVPEYQEEIATIENNEDLTELGKTEAKINAEETLQNELEQELESIQEELDQNPGNSELENKKAALETAIQNSNAREEELQEEASSILAQETGSNLSRESLINEIDDNYASEFEEINDNNTLSDLEKEEQLLAIDEQFLENAENLLEEVKDQLEQDPDNTSLQEKKSALTALVAEKEESIAERIQTINALQGESSVNNLATVKKNVIVQINPDFESELNRLENEKVTEQTIDEQISVYEDMISSLEKELKSVRKELKKDPENRELQSQEQAITELISEYEAKVAQLEVDKNVIANEAEILASSEAIISELDPGYSERVEELENRTESDPNFTDVAELQREDQELQIKVEERLDAINEALQLNGDDKELNEDKEQLELLSEVLENRINERSEQLDALSASAGIENVDELKEEIRNEIEPDYQEKVSRIEEAGLSEVEEAELMVELERDVRKGLKDERQELLNITAREPNNEEAKVKLQVVNDLITESEERIEALENIQEEKQQIETAFENAESLLNEIAPEYASEKASIERNSELDELSRLEQLQNLDEELLTQVSNELETARSDLEASPGNTELEQRVQQLEDLERALTSQIAARENEITELSSSVEKRSTQVNSEEVLSEISEDYTASIESINNSESSSLDKAIERLDKHVELKEELDKEVERIETELAKSAEDETLTARLEAVRSLQRDNETAIDQERTAISNEISDSDLAKEILNDVDPKFTADVTELEESDASTKFADLAEREVILQEKLEAEIEKKKEKLRKKYSVDVDVEILAMEKMLEESKAREAEYLSKNATAGTNQTTEQGTARTVETISIDEMPEEQATFVTEMRDEGLGRLASEIEEEYTDEQGLDKQNAILSRYENKLEQDIAAVESGEREASEEELTWMKNELDQVSQKRDAIKQALESIRSSEPVTQQGTSEEEYIADIRNELLGGNESVLTSNETSLEGLKTQDQQLAEYAEALDERLMQIQNDPEFGESEQLQNEAAWVEQELAAVAQKRRSIEISIGELETNVVSNDQQRESSFIEEQRKELLSGNEDILDQNYSTEGELISQDEQLANYASDIESEIERLKSTSDYSSNEESQEKVEWLENELDRVEKKRRSIQVSIGELETQVVSNDQREADFIEQKRADLLGQDEKILEENYTTEAELEEQDAALAEYEEELTAAIEDIQSSPDFESNEELKEEVNWMENEVERVQKKRKSIYVTIGELKTEVLADVDDPEINKLNQEEQQLEEVMNDPQASEEQKKAAQERIDEVQTERTERENELIAEDIDQKIEEQKAASEELEQLAEESGNTSLTTLAESAASRQEEVVAIVEQAEKADSPEEKQYLLKQAAEEQEKLNSDIEDVVIEEKVAQLEEESQVELDTKEELEKKKRRFMVDIGDLTTEIQRTDKEISTAKRKDREALETKKQSLVDERELTQKRLQRVNEQLESMEETSPVISDVAMKQEVGFNEERKLAASDEYKAYSEKAEEALELEEQITNLENDLSNDRLALKALLERLAAGEGIQVQVDEKVSEIKEKQTLLEQKRVELIQKKYTAEQLLPEDEEKAMKLQNLAIRGVKPIQTTAVAMAMLALPNDGLAIKENAESVYTEENPIPLEVAAPKGLVYRVQIGAFRKQIPQDLFSEFNPVTGEAIGNTGITRYMAGYFASSDKVAQAREQIRGLGYDDAFVVAYCDGKRVGYGDARRMEAAGTCVPQGESKLMMEVAENIAEEMGLPVKNEVEELPDYSYAQAPGAAPSSPIELTTGLFFTVQVGVFSKPVTKHDLLDMEDLFTIRLANGTIRYNSGMFNTVEDAKVRKKLANERGIKAFVTAYFEGERISIEEAQELLAQRGEGILQTRIAPPEDGKTTQYEVPDHIVRTDTVQSGRKELYSDETNERMQIVTKKSFDEFPRDILNRYNTKGTFYYDEKDGKVKSVVVNNEVHLPRVYKFRHDVDTLYLDRLGISPDADDTDIIKFTTLTQVIPGDLMDWMMRFNYRREFELVDEKYMVRMYGIEPDKTESVLEELRGFGYNPEIEELTEDELELNEQEE